MTLPNPNIASAASLDAKRDARGNHTLRDGWFPQHYNESEARHGARR